MNFLLKIFSKTGEFLTTIPQNRVLDEPSFDWKKNSSPGDISFRTNYRISEKPEAIKSNNILKTYVYDGGSEYLVYTGVISQNRSYIGRTEYITITALGLAYPLSFSFFKDGSSYQVAKSDDVSQIMRDIVDHANSTFPSSLILYTASTVTNTGQTSTRTFSEKKHIEAVSHTLAVSPDNWSWIIDGEGTFYFREKPSTATHFFTFGKHLELVDLLEDSEDVVNSVVFKYNGGSESYSDVPSGDFLREEIREDNQITNSSTAQNAAQKEVEEGKNPQNTIQMIVNRSYPIESIKPGDTCRIGNLPEHEGLTDNMEIVGIKYGLDRATLEIEKVRYDLSRDLPKAV